MLEYLKTAQSLNMFGVIYFDVKNKKKTEMKVGIDCFGLHLYDNREK